MASPETRGQVTSEVQLLQEREARVNQINSVFESRDLAHPYTETGIGDLDKGEIEILGAREVIPCGTEGLHLVQLSAQFTKDTINTETGEVKEGAKGAFWTFFRTKESTARQDIIIPYVKNAPGNFDAPSDIKRPDETIEKINSQLVSLHLKPLPPTVNLQGEKILDIANIIRNNERFFTVVVYRVQSPNGEIVEKPFVYNANSDSGIDGTVFAVTVRTPQYGMEPRLIVADSYRPNYGKWTPEVPRGFYSPRLGGQRRGFQARFTDVPVLKRAVEELSDETGLISSDNIVDMGKIRQDPSFEASEPNYFSLDAQTPQFTPQDMEVSERLRLNYLSLGEFFNKIRDINDPFTLTAVSTDLLGKGVLRINKACMEAQNEGERMAFMRTLRVQFGEHLTECIRNSKEAMPVDYSLGQIPVNTGIARIMPELYHGSTEWSDFKRGIKEEDLPKLQLLYPYEVLKAISAGKLDSVTTASAIKSLHIKGYLELNFAALK